MDSPPRLLLDDDPNSPTPNTSFCLLEARDSNADTIIPTDDAATLAAIAAAAAAANQGLRQPHHLQQQQQQQRQPYPTRQSPPERDDHHQYSPNQYHQQQNPSRQTPPLVPNRRDRNDSLHDLFPMINANVFTNPENIMPSYQDAIMIDDTHDSLSSFHDLPNNLTSNQNGLTVNQLSIGAIFGGLRTGGAASTRGAATTASRDPSCQSFNGEGLRSSDSGDSFSDTLRTNASFTLRTTPRQWLLSLWRRFNINWDSYFLLFTLVMSIAAIPVGVIIAAVFDDARPHKNYKLRCKVATRAHEDTTASIAAVTIPMMNSLVLLIVSLWVAIRCSQSRKRMLRSTAPASARINLSKLLLQLLLESNLFELLFY